MKKSSVLSTATIAPTQATATSVALDLLQCSVFHVMFMLSGQKAGLNIKLFLAQKGTSIGPQTSLIQVKQGVKSGSLGA